jgi:hypothetical protein
MTAVVLEQPVADVVAVLEQAAAVIEANGFTKRYLYDRRQAGAGKSLRFCRVDVIGALNIAAHGTPVYAGSPAVASAEAALLARITEAAIVTWNDATGRTAADAVALLRNTATELQAEEAK